MVVGVTAVNDALPVVSPESVWTRVEPEPHVDVEEEYSVAV